MMGQCGSTEIHDEHKWEFSDLLILCPGLTGGEVRLGEVPTEGPLSVSCPDCRAPAGEPCRTTIEALAGSVHGQRQRSADLFALEHGTCALCGAFMVRGTVLDSPVDAWHPLPADHGCPILPDPRTDWNRYAAKVSAGLTPGHPGLQHFIPLRDTTNDCPECRSGKCANCTFTIPIGDGPEVVPCPCGTRSHNREGL